MKLMEIGYETVHDHDFSIVRPNGYRGYLFLLIKTASFHVIKNQRVLVPADSIILYDDSIPQHYGAVANHYVDDWFLFSIEKTDLLFLERLNFPLNTILSLKDSSSLSELIRQLAFEFFSANRNKEESCSLYLNILFLKLNEMLSTDRTTIQLPFYNQLVTLRTQIYNTPDQVWKIDSIADSLNLSASYFQHTYKKLFGISVINDVIASRISHGKKLLSGTNFSIKKIAHLCGYEYDVYFMRQFKNYTGLTPKEYRNSNI